MKSYLYPLIQSYNSIKFKNEAKKKFPEIMRLKEKGVLIDKDPRKGSPWIRVRSLSEKSYSSTIENGWQPKLYICPNSPYYFDVISCLIGETEKLDLDWKFYNGDEMRRPDKIVLHFTDLRHLKRSLPHLRKAMKDFKFHSLSHSASTAQFGWEKAKARGFYVGADPVFLKNMSWRMYHAIVVAFISQNKEYWSSQKGGLSAAFKLFNISMDYEGPRKFRVSKSENAKIKKLWRQIV